VAASEYAGFSLTHRDHASMVTFVTGHETPDKPDTTVDYAQLAEFPGTLVFYMGLHNLTRITKSLLEHGRKPETPVAVISRATTPGQRTIVASLNEIAVAVSEAELHAPSLIIVGECVNQREQLAWFENRPLFGLRIGITRPLDQADPQIERALELGAQPILMPAIRIAPIDDWSEVDATLAEIESFDWLIFTSVNGVHSLLGRLWETGGDARKLSSLKIATIGSSTAKALGDFCLRADLVPEEFRAEGLANELAPLAAGKKILWARASRGRDVLPRELEQAGAEVVQLVVYQNVDQESLPEPARKAIAGDELDWIGLSSPSIARSIAELLPASARARIGSTIRIASISPVTSAAAREAGLQVHAEASTYTWDGIFEAIERAMTDRRTD